MERNRDEYGEELRVIWVPSHTLDPDRSQDEVQEDERKLAKARLQQGWCENLRELNRLADQAAGLGVEMHAVTAEQAREARSRDDLTQRMLKHIANVVFSCRHTRYQ